MPPRQRKTVKQETADLVEMCREHFPHGWRHVPEDQAAVACEHGEYTRESTFATGGLVTGPVTAVVHAGEQVLSPEHAPVSPPPETPPES